MSWAVVIERCELVGPCEDVHRGFILLGCVRKEDMEGGRNIPWVRRRIYLHRKLIISLRGVGKYSEYHGRVPRVEDADWYYKWTLN